MKKIICLIIIYCCLAPVMAAMYDFTDALGQTASLEVEYWTGSGAHETILVIDWNQSGSYVSQSHAFGYRWDGSVTSVADMLTDICGNGELDIDAGYGGAFVNNLFYNDADGDFHAHDEEGSFNLASTNDVFAQWGNMNGDWTMLGQWHANRTGITTEYIQDGQLEGINVMYWSDSSKPYENLDVPFASVPEPATMILLVSGGLLLRRNKKS